MVWTIKKKMFGMGVGVLIALTILSGMSYLSYRVVDVAMEKSVSRIQQMQMALDMKSAQLAQVLAAMESIVNRDKGKISEESMGIINKTSSVLGKNMKEFSSRIHTEQDRSAFAGLSQKIEGLDKIIKKDLVQLIEGSTKRLGEIDQEFNTILTALTDYSSKVENSIGTFEAALQFKINMASTEEESNKAKEGNELLAYIRRAVNNLVIAALESVVDKESGNISEKRMSTITRDADYLGKNIPNLSAYAQSDDEKQMLKTIQGDTDGLIRILKKDLVLLITKSSSEALEIEKAFKKTETDLSQNAAEVASKLDKIAGSSKAEAEEAILTLKSTQKSSFQKSMAVFLIAVLVIIPVILLLASTITNVLRKISSHMNESADQVASSSGQVSAASQSLAEGSSEQAASIEETSASLEEMSSMTKQNADNSAQADSLMKEANEVIAEANRSMTDLTHSMDGISKASEETSKTRMATSKYPTCGHPKIPHL